MTEKVVATGLLTEADVKRLAGLSRGGVVGPTAVYYAGVSAPVITASTALLTRQSLNTVGMSDYWQLLLSALIAALAGIAWYLIFIRWAYRHRFGRGTEVTIKTEITVCPKGLSVSRGEIETRIGWPAVSRIDTLRKDTVLTIDGADALIIPNKWFGDDIVARERFQNAVRRGAEASSPRSKAPCELG